ncbi:MAG: hypothetical protein LBR67_03530 [Dysgonamonadaceae bacterium]|jgi:uncharacterized protein (TIGR02145 family)|nr:hypothetical protein [Dysgonamonadaceae bacterium]
MKRFKFDAYSLFGLILAVAGMASCKETVYEVSIPETNIMLLAPENNSYFDLNEISSYTFQWNAGGKDDDYVILFSPDSNLLKDPIHNAWDVIEAGNVTSYTLNADDWDRYLATWGMKTGTEAVFYWAVKPQTADYSLSPAASEIRRISVKRLISKLSFPNDRFLISLSYENPDSTCRFQWESDGTSDNLLVFSASPQFAENNTVSFPAGINSCTLSHSQLQTIIGQLKIDPYRKNSIYWNVRNSSTRKLLSPASATLLLEGMFIFIDKRGNEEITYRVTRLTYSDGEEVIWLADNLRATNYPDATPIESENLLWAANSSGTTEFSPEEQFAFGGHYAFAIRHKVAPTGWHIPTKEEFQKLFREASLAQGGYNVLKDPVFYKNGIIPANGHVNDWKLNLVASGRYLEWNTSLYLEAGGKYVVFHYADPSTDDGGTVGPDNKTIMHDGGDQLWYPPYSKWAPIRVIFGD